MEIDHAGGSYVATVKIGDAFLEHHGVKGMKWGVRRNKKLVAKRSNGKLIIGIEKKHPVRKAKTKHQIQSMSDSDLRKLVERTELENRYLSATKKKKSEGQRFVEDFLKSEAKRYVKNAAAALAAG